MLRRKGRAQSRLLKKQADQNEQFHRWPFWQQGGRI